MLDTKRVNTDDTAWTIVELRHSLQALAMPADVQLALYPDFVCKGDELAIDFDNFYRAVRGNYPDEFSADQWATLEAIDRVLEEMSGAENAERWTDNAVRTSSDWSTVRELARIALDALGWEVTAPPSSADRGNTYVPAGPDDRTKCG